jgi:hypothetical protein
MPPSSLAPPAALPLGKPPEPTPPWRASAPRPRCHFGDALSPNRYSVLLSVNTGNGFTPDPTGQLLRSSTRGGEIRVQITRLSGGLAQDLLDSFRLPGSCKEMRTEWVVHRE